ncbi:MULTISPECIES: trimeric intracellular cation channel family protein [Arthrobacter]|uniref:Trimeric intracellular cation channel family protein n=1 Tax=Arthrobacter oryzae TaxID=409290 RepID=A0A3N0BKY5_9MICC|nr:MULTISPECIES: trimeric intracellular cation channel family protein [Arthrobacter]QYF89380.1 trimeric intracellular cation channel family protein [Arthrobacter sp. PAMC25284]RNL48742.1 trimeric intracellular cation channel family protein [Arthrobacter oryzae]
MTFSFNVVLVWLELAGVFFFAVSGSLLAARKQFDMIGSLLLASLVSLGGGVIRDIIINAGPPAAFTNPAYLAPPLLATVLVYFLFNGVQRFTSLLTLFDAGGLALFCISGTLTALAAGMHPFAAVLLGVTTAVGGGLLRDITANEVPQLFNSNDLYALPAFLGSALTVVLSLVHSFNVVSAGAVAVLVFVFRVTAWRRQWRIPLAVRGWHRLGLDGADSGSRD